MGRRGWWLTGIAAVVLIPLGAAAVFAATFDVDRLRPALIGAIEGATGRTLTIEGTLRMSRSLWPTLQVDGVRLGNIAGGTRPDIARAERIEARLDLLSLLHRTIDITELTLIGPNILFEQVGGTPNWVFTPAAPQSDAAPTGAAPSGWFGGGFGLRVRAAHVQNGMVTWRLPARTKVVGVRMLDYRHERRGGPFEMRSTLVYSDNKPFSLDVKATPTGDAMAPWQTQLAFAAFDTKATARGTMQVSGPYDLQVDATSGALEQLNALLPEMHLPPVRQLRLSTRIGNGTNPGDLPVIGTTDLAFASADLGATVPGLLLGATTAKLASAGAVAAVESVGTYIGTPFHVRWSVTVPTRLDGPTRLPLDLKLDSWAPQGSLVLKGALSLDTLRFAGLDTQAALKTPALARLRPVLGPGVPALTQVAFDGHLVVPPQPPSQPGRLIISDATLRSEQGDLDGQGEAGFGTPVSLSGNWHSASFDLDAMLLGFGIDLSLPGGGVAASGPMIPNTPLPWAGLRGPTLDLTLDVERMRFQGETWRNVALPIQLEAGRLQAAPVRFDGVTGRVDLAVTIDGRSAAAPVSLSLQAPALPLAFVVRVAGLPGPATGTARVDLRLQGAGRTVRDVARSLDGTFWIAAVGARFSNAALLDLTSAALDALSIKVPRPGDTRLDCFGLAGSFAHGVGTLRTIALQTDHLTLEGAGTVDLGRETVDLHLAPLAQVAGAAVRVPVLVQGPFRSVSGTLEASGLDKLGYFLTGVFGGDDATACIDAGLVPKPG